MDLANACLDCRTPCFLLRRPTALTFEEGIVAAAGQTEQTENTPVVYLALLLCSNSLCFLFSLDKQVTTYSPKILIVFFRMFRASL
jgi:hypothetical protein